MGKWAYLIAALAIFFIRFASVRSEGIGLLSRPALIFIGFLPDISLGSFRVSNLIAKVVGIFTAVQKGEPISLEWKRFVVLFLPSFIGGVIGAELVNILDEELIKLILGVFILLMGILICFNREFMIKEEMTPASNPRKIAGFFCAIAIGIVAAFIGGSGILLAYLMLFIHNKGYLRSMLSRKIANFGSALGAGVLFIYYGIIDWQLVLVVVLGSILGEFFGTKYSFKISERWLRIFTLLVVFATGIAMFFV